MRYMFRVAGPLPIDWEDWLDGLRITRLDASAMVLEGEIADQAALHGVLQRLQALNITLLGLSAPQ